jgi:hypothetical protein
MKMLISGKFGAKANVEAAMTSGEQKLAPGQSKEGTEGRAGSGRRR